MTQSTTTGQYMRNLKTVHRALLAGIVLFTIIAAVVVSQELMSFESGEKLHNIFKFIAPVFTVLAILAANLVFKKKTDELKQASNTTLRFRLEQYRAASMQRWATTELPLFFSIVALILTGEYYYGIFIFLVLVFFILYAPDAGKVSMHLQLGTTEAALLEDEYAEIG
jgi:hypothetical protein